MSTPVLSCQNVTRSFVVSGRQHEVLAGISLDLSAGEILTIKGRSGEGKTTLLWLLGGIDTPSSGEVYFQGRVLSGLHAHELHELRRKKIGLLFQNFNLIPAWTALENVEAALLNSGFSKQQRHERAVELLQKMEMADRLNNVPVELSAGQQQRVALARALINEPEVILADEPTGNVDDETADFMLQVLHDQIKRTGAAMIVATHGHYQGEKHATRILSLHNGRLS